MNYCKITNSEENHKNMQYKTGLNVDIFSFNPSGDCAPGGIYFSREDILSFLNYGTWIREVTLPEDAQVYENPGIPKKWKADKVILGERRKIDLEVIKSLIEEGADIHADNDYVLRWSAENGYLETVKYLVKKGSNINAYSDCALRYAANNGHLEVVKYFVEEGANIHANSFPFFWSSWIFIYLSIFWYFHFSYPWTIIQER
jgi:ankyrin repeat protein